MPYKLIALDLDGTLLDPEHRLSAANSAAVRACVAGGVRVLIATGRLFASAGVYVRELGLTGPQIMLNGSVFADPSDGHLHVREQLSHAQLAAVLAILVAHAIPYTIFGAARIYAEPGTPHLEVLDSYGEPPAVLLPRDELLALPQPLKVLTFLPPGEYDQSLAAQLGGRVEVVRTGPRFLEFLPPGVSKGAALSELLGRYAVEPAEVLAIGDGENDLSMFGVAGMSLAMPAAPAAVRAAARALAPPGPNAVAQALYSYILSPGPA